MDPTTQLLLQAGNTVGVVAVCVIIILAFLRGDIISKGVFDRVLSMYEKQMADATKLLAERLSEIVDKSMAAFLTKLDESMDRMSERLDKSHREEMLRLERDRERVRMERDLERTLPPRT